MSGAAESDIPVLIFTRTPAPGKVKTRLIPAIGAERAANLHRAMLWRTVATATAAAVGPVTVWCDRGGEHPFITEIQREFAVLLAVQEGANLGERMHRALCTQPAGGCGAVLIGADCPFLETGDLQQAAAALRAGLDAVIGPAQDGGYYLIGARASDQALFSGITWGSHSVLAATRRNCRALGWRWRELAMRRDVDRPEDLEALADLMVY